MKLISEYHNQILPGTYALKTSMTTQEMFPILAQADKITETENSTFIAPGMQADTEETAGTDAEAVEKADSAAEDGGVQETSESTESTESAAEGEAQEENNGE